MESETPQSQRQWPTSLLYVGTIFLSAFLLFQVQPLISNYILPWFGGSPAVWTTCLLFFQTLLFAGYAYAHWSEHYLSARGQALIHLILIAVAIAVLPIEPSETWKPLDSGSPTSRILLLLTVCVGVPYFLLSTTGPLIQAWFSRFFPDRSPYRLYALSNLGSLLALLSYPFLVEPAMDVVTQAKAWSGGFLCFAVLCGVAAYRAKNLPKHKTIATDTAEVSPTWLQRCLWLALPAFATMTLLAVTNHVCQDVAPVPFLWVVPLSLYLISFILTFDHERWYWRLPFGLAAILGVYAAIGVGDLDEWRAMNWLYDTWNIITGNPAQPWKPDEIYTRELLAHFTALFALCVVCHGELVRQRPAPRYLTSFYLMISAGGALGGLFVSLIAPQIFASYLEWRICMFLGLMLAWVTTFQISDSAEARFNRRIPWQMPNWVRPLRVLQILGVLATGLVLFDMGRMLGFYSPDKDNVRAQSRNFFGAVKVLDIDSESPAVHRRELLNGRILHGVQFLAEDRRHWPTTYYAEESGVGRTLGYYRRYNNMRVGAVGLGVGTLAAYAMPGHTFRFYEINPEVPRLAEEHFSFLKNAKAQGALVEIVLGDARLSLERELAGIGSQKFDLLVLDAFSGDAIPNHLSTREAFDVYLPHLAQGGALAVHISNRYLDLSPVVYGLARHFHLQSVRLKSSKDNTRAVSSSEWIILSKNKELIDVLREATAKKDPDKIPENLPVWTDRHHNVFDILN